VIAALALGAGAPAARAVPLGGTVLVDRPSGLGALPFDGIANSFTSAHDLTADGRFVVFSSQSNALLAGDEDSATNVYRVDLTTGALVQVDTTATGGQPTPGSANDLASISADANHVGFRTTSPALAAGANDHNPQFVVKNLTTGGLEVASRSTGAAGAPVAGLQSARLSGDGRHVAFTAQSAVQADNATGLTTTTDAYERLLDTNVTHMVSVTDPNGVEGGGVRDQPDIDFAGDAVAFSTINALTAGDTDTHDDAYFHTVGGTEHTVLVSFSGGGQTLGADGGSDVAVSGGPAGLELAWTPDQRVEFFAPCATTSCTVPAVQADHALTGGHDSGDNDTPFFPPQPNATTLPTRVYWNSRDPLDPADTNNSFDLYGREIANTSIHLMTGGDATGGVFGSAATDDGSVVSFESNASNLPGSDGGSEQAFVRKGNADLNISQPFGQPPRTSAAGSGFVSQLHAVSDDGHLVAFTSDAPAFGGPITSDGPADQVLVRDVVSGQTQLVSAVPGGGAGGNGGSDRPSIDAAGDRVVFESTASNLLPGDTNDNSDVFLRDLSTGKTSLVDTTAGGGSPSQGASTPEISADGKKVVYESSSTDIPAAPPDGHEHIYEVDLASGEVTLIDRSSTGAAGDEASFDPDIDGDGARIAFVSTASNLGGGTSGSVYVRDLTNPAQPTTTWVSAPADGMGTHDQSSAPSIDGDGARVAWTERNPAFGFGMTSVEQVFVRDLGTHTTTLASAGSSGAADVGAFGASLSTDGTRLTFTSAATNLPGAIAGFANVFLRDLPSNTTTLGSTRDATTSAGRFGSDGGSLSGNGACVAFGSNSDDLVAGGYGSDFEHVFLHALSAACPTVLPVPDTTPPAISDLKVTHRRFADGSKPTAVSAAKRRKKPKKVAHGTAFKFSLSEAATTRIVIAEKRKGHRAGSKRPCKAARRGQKLNCTHTITLVTLVRAHTGAGANTVAFSGRYGRKRLAKGTYKATVTATDASNNVSKARSVTFTVVG
jgi:Tol biopolymer transport system component